MNLLITLALTISLVVPARVTAVAPTPVNTQATSGCEPPPVTSSLSSPAFFAPPWFYASSVVGATDVISPENALGVEDGKMAVLTATSVLTLSWSDTFDSGIAIWLYYPHSTDSDCAWPWLYTQHYAGLAQSPIYTATNYFGWGWGWASEYKAPFMPLHRYVVLRFNALVYVDAVYYPRLARRWWLPLVMSHG